MKKIQTSTQFLLKFLLHLLVLPIYLVQYFFGKRRLSEVFPLKELKEFIFEPQFTITIIIINIVVFIATLFIDITPYLLYPQDIFQGRFITLLTAGFLHADLAHIFFNMWALFIFGRVVEREFGSGKTAVIYFVALLLSGILTSVFHVLILGDNIPGLGASGALMGIMAAAVLIAPFSLTYEAIIPLPIMFVGWLTVWGDISGLLSGVQDGIGHMAHLGGFFAVTLWLYLFEKKNRDKLKKGLYANLFSLALGIVLYFFLF